MQIACECHYDAAHWLPAVPQGHKCGRLHGHTYHLTVIIDGPICDDGWVMDFADIKTRVQNIIQYLDHYCLNDVAGLENPTVENQLVWLWGRINLPLYELRLCEGESNTAIYRGDA